MYTRITQRTWVELTLCSDKENLPDSFEPEFVKEIIRILLDYLNNILLSYRYETENTHIRPVDLFNLPQILIVKYNQGNVLYLLRPLPIDIKDIKFVKIRDIFPVNTITLWENYPQIASVEKYFELAKHNALSENLRTAIIDLQTSFEIFVRWMLKIIYTKNNIETNVTEIKMMNVMNSLGDYLHIDKNHNSLKLWRKNIYDVRNDIVHEGSFDLTNVNVIKAVNIYIEARNYIRDAMVDKKYLEEGGVAKLHVNTRKIDIDEVKIKLKKFGL